MQVLEFGRKFADNAPVPKEVRSAIWRGTMDHGESLQVQSRRHGVTHQQAFDALAEETRERITAAFHNGWKMAKRSSTPPAAPVARRAA